MVPNVTERQAACVSHGEIIAPPMDISEEWHLSLIQPLQADADLLDLQGTEEHGNRHRVIQSANPDCRELCRPIAQECHCTNHKEQKGMEDKTVNVNKHKWQLNKKEHIWLSSNKVDKPRAYYANWSKSERERQTSYINVHIWYPEPSVLMVLMKPICRAAMQTQTQQGMSWDSSTEICASPCGKSESRGNLLFDPGAQIRALWRPREVGWSGGWEGGSWGSGHTYTHGWFMLIYRRNQHNIIKQVSS